MHGEAHLSRRLRALSPAEWALLAALTVWSLLPLAIELVHVARHGGVIGGADARVGDDYQYLAWIREAGEHVLISNRLDVAHYDAVWLNPLWLLGGALWKLGASIQASFLLLKPLAVLTLFAGFVAYVRRMVPGRVGRAAALLLALFFVTPAYPLLEWSGVGSAAGQGVVRGLAYFTSPATYLWGYFHIAIAVGLMPVFVLCVERLLDPERRRPGRGARTYALWASAAGLVVSWLHPWQGMTLVGIVLGLAVWSRLPRRHLALVAPTLATLAPLVYYVVLSRTDAAWRHGNDVLRPEHYPLWAAVALAPLVLAALVGYVTGGRRPFDDAERMLLLWPLAAIATYAILRTSFFFHAFSGISLPLAVLAARARVPRTRLAQAAAALALALLVLPGVARTAQIMRRTIDSPSLASFLTDGEAAALRYLDGSPRRGAVLAPFYLDQAVPGHTGRRAYVAHPSWTPDFDVRYRQMEAFFSGRIPPAEARAIVRRSGAAFVVSDCQHPGDLRPLLGPLVAGERRFGCATVYEVARPG